MAARINVRDLPPAMQAKYAASKRRKPAVKLPKPLLRGTPHKIIGLRLPMPPSVNYYIRQVRSPAIKAYREAVAEACMEQGVGRVIGERIGVFIWVYGGKADLDNLLKGCLDGMQAAGVFENDRFITKLSINRAGGTHIKPYLSVELEGDMP